MIGLKYTRHFFIQSEENQNQSHLDRTRFPALCVSYLFIVFTMSFDWFIGPSVPFVIG